MKEIKCIIFDFGGVISTGHVDKYVDKMAGIIGVSREDFLPSYFIHRKAYDQGAITVGVYWKEICSSFGLQLSQRILGQLMPLDIDSWTTINQKMVAYILAAKKKAGKVVLLSNINYESLAYLEDRYDWMRMFDHRIYSCELKLLKPERAIYESTLETVAYKPEDCLFIDDSPDNAEGARACGMNAIHFTGFDAFIQEMEERYTLVT